MNQIALKQIREVELSGYVVAASAGLSGLIAITTRLYPDSTSTGVLFGQTLLSFPVVCPSIYASGTNTDLLSAYVTAKTTSGCTITFSDRVTGNNYYLDILARTPTA